MSIGRLKRLFGADAKIDALAEHLAELRSEVTTLGQRVLMAERDAHEAAVVETARHRRIAALTRMLRAGGRRLDLLASSIEGNGNRGDEADEAIARLRASLLALNVRVEAEAEDTRRIATALLERISADCHPAKPV